MSFLPFNVKFNVRDHRTAPAGPMNILLSTLNFDDLCFVIFNVESRKIAGKTLPFMNTSAISTKKIKLSIGKIKLYVNLLTLSSVKGEFVRKGLFLIEGPRIWYSSTNTLSFAARRLSYPETLPSNESKRSTIRDQWPWF